MLKRDMYLNRIIASKNTDFVKIITVLEDAENLLY